MSNAKDVSATVSPLAGWPVTSAMPVDVQGLSRPTIPACRIIGLCPVRRGTAAPPLQTRSTNGTFWRGPLFLGIDTHALSVPACASAIEVLAANGVHIKLATADEYTPTPVISRAILTYSHGRDNELANGLVITPSHNPPA
jgi:hypothetical protein